jgi:uncharacterized membrane protein YgcG
MSTSIDPSMMCIKSFGACHSQNQKRFELPASEACDGEWSIPSTDVATHPEFSGAFSQCGDAKEFKMKMQMQSDSTAKLVAALTLSAVVMAYTVGVQAQDTTSSLTPIYGSQLMSDPERSAYQTKMRSLKTDQAREAFRLEHHEEMKIRAAARGVTLPNEPPAKGLGIQGNAPKGAVQGGATGKSGGMGSATGGGASAGSGSGAGPGAGGGRK